jgi:pimeloyl-ACP methyl ester carboxylesterase
MARSDDLLFGHLDLLPALPGHITVQRLPAENAAWSEAVGDALARGASGPPPEIPAPRLGEGWHEVVRVPGGTIAVRCFGHATTKQTIVLLSGIPGSARGEAGLARALGDGRRVLGVDVPGFGASTLTGEPDAGAIATAIRTALASLGVAGFDVVAVGESGAIGCALGGRATVLVDPVPDTARDGLMTHMADLTPRSDGSHLLAAWHQLRDSCLWRPWHTRLHATALEIGPDPDVGRLHAIFSDWLLGGTEGRRTLAAALSIPVPAGAVAIEGVGPDPRTRAQAILGALDRPC